MGGGGGKAPWNFSKNSSVLVPWPVPNSQLTLCLILCGVLDWWCYFEGDDGVMACAVWVVWVVVLREMAVQPSRHLLTIIHLLPIGVLDIGAMYFGEVIFSFKVFEQLIIKLLFFNNNPHTCSPTPSYISFLLVSLASVQCILGKLYVFPRFLGYTYCKSILFNNNPDTCALSYISFLLLSHHPLSEWNEMKIEFTGI